MANELLSPVYVTEPLIENDEDIVGGRGKKYSNECYFWLEFLNYDPPKKNDFVIQLEKTKDGFIDWKFLLGGRSTAILSPIDQYKEVLKLVLNTINGISQYPVVSSQVISSNYLKNLNHLADRVISDKVESITRARADYENPSENYRNENAEHHRLRVREDLFETWKQIHHKICAKNRILPPILKYSLVFLASAFVGFIFFKFLY